jgi:hypothetical protein
VLEAERTALARDRLHLQEQLQTADIGVALFFSHSGSQVVYVFFYVVSALLHVSAS